MTMRHAVINFYYIGFSNVLKNLSTEHFHICPCLCAATKDRNRNPVLELRKAKLFRLPLLINAAVTINSFKGCTRIFSESGTTAFPLQAVLQKWSSLVYFQL